MPSLIQEFVGAICRIPPQQCRDHVDHHSEFVFGDLHFRRRLFVSPYLIAPLEDIRAISFPRRDWKYFWAFLGFRYEPSHLFCDEIPMQSWFLRSKSNSPLLGHSTQTR